MKNKDDKRVVCPFFRFWETCTIGCEGFGKAEKIRLVFISSGSMEEYLNAQCRDCWERCPYAEFLKKYKYGIDD